MNARATPQSTNDAGPFNLHYLVEKYGGWIIMGVFGWLAWTTFQTSLQVAVISAKLDGVTAGRYSATDALKDQQTLNERMNGLANRITAVEAEVRSEN